jgi:hypothetical protein
MSSPVQQPGSRTHDEPRAVRATAEQQARTCMRLVLLAIALHAALTAWLALARFAAVHNQTFDLALYARLAWGLVHAEPWDPIVGGNFLGGHMPWVLLPLGALGALLGTVPVLLVAQSLCVALAALPIARAATRRLGPPAGVVAALAFLLYPNLGHVATYEFHPGTLAILPLACALEVLDRPAERAAPRELALWCALALACRVSLALQTVLIGLLALGAGPRMRRTGIAIALGSLGYFLLSLLVLQPAFGAAPSNSADLHFAQWGGSPLGALRVLWSDPARVVAHLLAPERLSYLPRVLAPLLFLPLLAPRYLLVALPPLALNLLSAFPTASELRSHYLTPALPALVMAAVAGAHVLVPFMRTAVVLAAMSAAAVAGHVLAGGLPGSITFDGAAFRADADTRARRALLAHIPEGASVQAPDPLLPHLSERRSVHRAPPPDRGTEFVALDVAHRRLFARQESLLRTVQEPVVRSWLARPEHRVVFAARDLILLRRGLSPRGGLGARYLEGRAPIESGQALSACLAVRGAELSGEQLHLRLVARAACPHDLAIRFGASARPSRADLLFDGLLSPAHLRPGDAVRSTHALAPAERAAIVAHGLYVGALRSSGARPEPGDPKSLHVPVRLVR